MTTVRRSGRNARPQALKEPSTSGSDDSDEEAFAELESPSKKPVKKAKAPRRAKPVKDAENEAPNSKAAAVQDPENYVDRVERAGTQFAKDILTDHLDPETEEQSAIVTLLNVVGQYAGRLQGREWTPDEYPAQTLEELAESVQDAIDKDGGIDHFKLTLRNGAVRKPAERLKVRKKVESFWYTLAMEAHTQGIDVLELLDPICDLCILLCASLTWVTRYAAVTVALSIMTALVDIMAQEEDRRSMLDRQLKAHTSKQSRRSTGTPGAKTPEAKSLQRERDRVHSTVSVLSKRLSSLFDCIVVERCRDTQAAVRTDVVEAVGAWTAQCPGHFMEDKYLRYLAWGMADRDPSVRMASIDAITKLLTDEEDVEALGPFVERFRHRILEAAADVDVGVCSAAFSLLQLLLQNELVNLAQLAPIVRWFDPATHTGAEASFQPVAMQAAELIAAALQSHAADVEEQQSDEENVDTKSQRAIPNSSPSQAAAMLDGTPGGRSQRAAKDKANAAITGAGKRAGSSKSTGGEEDGVQEVSLLTALRALFRLLAAEQAQQAHLPLPHSVMLLLVTHLQPQMPVLTKWQSLVRCLTAEVTEGLPQVEIQDVSTLIACCLEAAVAAEGKSEDPAAPGRKGKSKRASKEGAVCNTQQEATLVLMDTLPALLRDWSTDQHIVGELVSMMCHLDYTLFISHKRTAAFKQLVTDVSSLFNRMHDVNALTACTQALAHCSQLPQAALSEPAKAASESVLQSTLEKLRDCGDQLVQVDESVLMEGRMAIQENGSQAAVKSKQKGKNSSADDSANLVFAMHGAIRRAMRLSMHSAWNLQLAADTTARDQFTEVIAAYLAGRPVPTTLVRGALWTLWYLLVAEVQLMYRMAHQGGASHTALSQEGLANDISNVATAARSLVQYLSEIVMKVPKHSSSQVTPSSQHAAKTIDFIDMRKHASCALIEVLCLCNARIADSSTALEVSPDARRQVEGLEVEVSDEVADALWAFVEGVLDEKCRLQALIADLEESTDPDSRAQKETDEINKAIQYDSTLLRMCKETIAGLMRCVLCGSLGTHCVAFAGQILAHSPLPHADLQTMVLAFISKLKKQAPHMVADSISHALQSIFDELCMVESSRYGLEDFDEIAAILARPLTEFGTPQPMLVSLWNSAAAFVAKDRANRTEYFTYAMVHFVPGLSSDSASAILKKLEEEPAKDEEQSMAALAAAQPEKGAEFLAALRKRASKKPMPSAMKGNKGKKPAGNRKRITFVESDADDENEAADGNDSEYEEGGAASGDADGRSKKTKTKGKGGKKGRQTSGKGRQAANAENVKKLVDLGDGWKRRVNPDEEEDEIEDDLDDSKADRPVRSPARPQKSPAPGAKSPAKKRVSSQAAASPASTPSRVTRQSSQAERDELHAHVDRSPLLASGPAKSGRGGGVKDVQHTPPRAFGSPVERRDGAARATHATPGSGNQRGSLHASEEDLQPSSQNAPGSLAASIQEEGAGVSQGPAGSLAASDFKSSSQGVSGSRGSGRRTRSVVRSQETAQTGGRRRSGRLSQGGADSNPSQQLDDDDDDDLQDAGGVSAGMDSMPQALAHGSNESLGMGSMPLGLQGDGDNDGGAADEDEEMSAGDEEEDAGEEEEEQNDQDQDEEMAADNDDDEDSEPEETMLKPVRRRR